MRRTNPKTVSQPPTYQPCHLFLHPRPCSWAVICVPDLKPHACSVICVIILPARTTSQYQVLEAEDPAAATSLGLLVVSLLLSQSSMLGRSEASDPADCLLKDAVDAVPSLGRALQVLGSACLEGRAGALDSCVTMDVCECE